MIRNVVLLIVAVFIFSTLSADWIAIDDNSNLFEHRSFGTEITDIQFSLNGFEMENVYENGVNYKKITYSNEGCFLDFGKPDLPRFTRMFAIPDEDGVRFEITHIQSEIISDITVYPIQELQSESQPNRNEFSIDDQFYAGNEVFPAELINISEPMIFRDIRLVSVTFNPFQYDPAKKELRVIRNIEISLISDNSGKAGNPRQSDRKLSRSFEKLYEAVVENYDAVTSNTDEIYQEPCYLFIYPNDNTVLTTLQYLTDWKQLKGFEVHLASTAVTGNTTSTIKNYIQNAYDTWENPPEFVTFVGDASGSYNIPTYFETYSGYNGEGDHPYSQLEGGDILADVILGRLSFNSINEFEVIIHKILHYEKTPYMGNTAWYNRAVMVGDPSPSGPSVVFTKQSIKEMIDYHAPNIVSTEYYTGGYSSGMSTQLNIGVAYLNYRGYVGMSGFNNNSINALNNGLMLPFAVFLTCGTGSFATETSPSETFIRAGTATNQKGAIAAVGTATWGTHTTFNNSVDAGTYYGVFTDQIYNPGGALVRGKLHLFNSFPGDPGNRVTIFSHWNSLMGDPGVELWTGIPQELTVEYPSEINVGTNFLEVSVTNASGLAEEGAWVCARSDNGSIFMRDYTNEDGMVYLPLELTSVGTVNLTVTKHNCIPHLGSFDVVSEAVFVNVNSFIIDDDMSGTSSGNSDGMVNPGETIELQVGLKNFGTNTANNVTGTITSDTGFITILDDEETFGNITGGSINYSVDDFDFSVESNVLGGMEIQLDLQIEDSSGDEWNDHIFIPVAGANLYVSDYSVEDANGLLDPGDTAQIVVTLFNTGSAEASGIQGELACGNAYITLVDSLATFETIQPGQEGDNNTDRFEVTADSHCIHGSQIQFTIHLFNIDGFDQTVTFLIDVGTVAVTDPLGPDSYGYSAYDSTDETYDLAPIYNWIEIDPAYGGSGTVLNLFDGGNDGDVIDVNVPFMFNFYGINYNMISVCTNGWIAPGGSSQASFMNSQLPAPQGPSPMIAPFWDDLKTGSGHVCYFNDPAEHAFIVEWSHLQADWNNDEETFQVLIYDPAVYPTPSGDAEIVFQYQIIHNVSVGSYSGGVQHGQYSSVGLEDQSGTIGLEYTYNNSYPTAAAPLADELAIKFTTMGGSAQSPPILSLNQNSFNFLLQPGTSGTQNLEITNNGEANLIYNLTKNYAGYSDDQGRGHGGPDAFGYQWFDSNEENGPDYNWRDISGLGTEVTFIDNNIGTDLMPIGFNFYFYGTYYSEFRINPNGWVGFGEDNTVSNNYSLPHPGAPKPAIMSFWDDLDPVTEGNVYYFSTPDSLIIWFDDVIHHAGNYNGTYDFQIIIYPTGDIVFQYQNMTGDIDSATIGIQDTGASDALQIVYNGPYVENELCVVFRKVVDWMQMNPTYGYVEQGEMASIDILANAEELIPGIFSCELILTTNDPNATVVAIPIYLQVSNEFPHIHLSQNSFEFGTVMIGDEVTDTLFVENTGNQELNVSNIEVSLPEFSVNTNSFILAPFGSTEVYITFTPDDTIVYEAVMSISSNDPMSPVVSVDLNGDSIFPIIELSATSFDFGLVDLQTEAVDTLVVYNTGTDILHVSNLLVSGDVFSVNTDSFDVQPDGSVEVLISFIPVEEINYNETITLNCDDPFNPVLEIELSGTGENPVGVGDILPAVTEVYQNFPNPFNPDTTIRYSVSEFAKVTISVYNIRGEKVRTLVDACQEPQWYEVVWNGCDDSNKTVSSGVYFYKFTAGRNSELRKMLLIK
ncbi:MAG: C25 family cysteine peptidase [Candidatus Cloacimonadales bacterium]|nr:C25 family cysteine peptidase [Candidatus Cloacimonadales bacterium]